MLGVKACAAVAILRLATSETLVLYAAEVKMAFQSADPAHLGAAFPRGLSTTLGAAEVMSPDMFWPSLLSVPQNCNTIGQVKTNPVPIRVVRGVWGQLKAVEACLAPLVGQQALGLGLNPGVSRIVNVAFEDSPVLKVLSRQRRSTSQLSNCSKERKAPPRSRPKLRRAGPRRRPAPGGRCQEPY